MKIAAAALTDSPDSRLSSHPARAPYFLIFNEMGIYVELLYNPFRWGGGDKGYGIGNLLKENMVGTLVAGKFRQAIIEALEQSGLKLLEGEGIVQQTIDELVSMDREEAELDIRKA